MKRFPIILPAATASLASLGALMYAGSKGYNCVGAYDNRPVAHPPIDWRVYVVVGFVAVIASLVPLFVGRRRGDVLYPQ